MDPDGRAVLYVGATLGTAGAEVFGDARVARVCTNYRAALLCPSDSIEVQSLIGVGSMQLGAFPSLGSGQVERAASQEWACAIYEDLDVCGVRYRSAHDEGIALALWENCPSLTVAVSRSDGPQDFQLLFPSILRRFKSAMAKRHIRVVVIDSASCRECARSIAS